VKKEWYLKNKERHAIKGRENYEKTREAYIESPKTYYEQNKEKVKQQQRERYEKLREKVECECGSKVCKYSLTTHYNSKKHKEYARRQSFTQLF
jgi:succinate dehydrogenase/fumarate reductase-like Fe-S protein